MDISLLTRYSSYSLAARGFSRPNSAKRPQAAAPADYTRTAEEHGAEVQNKRPVKDYRANQLKRVGYTELGGSWDQFMLARFVETVERSTGGTLDAGAIMRKYDADGDGLLNTDEQTAMIEGLTKSELERFEFSRAAAESIIEQLKGLSGREDTRYATGLLKAARRYERLFLYEDIGADEEAAVVAV